MLGEYVVLNVLGFAVPFGALALLWRFPSSALATATLMTFAVLTTLGMGRTIPLLGLEVAGGSTYLPAMYLALALTVKALGGREARYVLIASTVGIVLLAIAHFRWMVFAEVSPSMTTHLPSTHAALLRHAVLVTMLLYFGGLVLLSGYAALADHPPKYRLTLPLVLDIALTTPISVITLYLTTGKSGDDWETLVAHTTLVRMVLPVLVLLYITQVPAGGNHVAPRERESDNFNRGTGSHQEVGRLVP